MTFGKTMTPRLRMGMAGLLILAAGSVSRAAGSGGDLPEAPRAYADLLAAYVVTTTDDARGAETTFDYAALHARPDGAALRQGIRDAFLAVDPAALPPAVRRAWAVNAYNFFVMDLVTENLVGEGGDTLASIADIGAGSFSVFDEERFAVAGTRYSLNRFEHHFLFDDIDRKSGLIPEGLDPRFHFALVCAARGCPPLFAEPFRAATLDAQLGNAARNALTVPRQLTRKGPVLHVSKIFTWYAADFGGRDGIDRFLARYAPEPVRFAYDKGVIEAVLTDLDWDWSLNIAR